MGVVARELLGIMSTRLSMQEKGITNPHISVKNATKALVDALSKLDPDEEIGIEHGNGVYAKYFQVSNGEVLAIIEKV